MTIFDDARNAPINVCNTIEFPYSSNKEPFGCQRYSMASSCHLAWSADGVAVPGFASTPVISKYWLFADETCDIESAKARNQEFLAQADEQARLKLRLDLESRDAE